MQTKSFAVHTAIASNLRVDLAEARQAGPVELNPSVLPFVAGGLAPRGGWDSASLVAATTSAPRGGW